MADRVGQQLGNYQLLRFLGEGSFAEVYLGKHIYLETQTAVKVLHTHLARSDIEQFRHEARAIAHLEHPHIVRVFDFGIEGTTPFLVMSYAPGGTLRKRHTKGTRISTDLVVSYVNQVASALQFAHDHKIIHRDVKPENLLVGSSDNILLSDFGIALIVQSSRYQRTQDVAGTMAYMAPEQIQGNPRSSSDQYSLAIVVYEWLTGDRPFHGSLTELVGQHLSVAPPSLLSKTPTISPEVDRVVQTALAKDPKDRYASIIQFAKALQEKVTDSAGGTPLKLFLAANLGMQEDLNSAPTVDDKQVIAALIEQGVKAKNAKEAIRSYDQALLIDPANTDALWRKAEVLSYKLGNFEEAIQLYDQILSINPQDRDSLGEKANLLHLLARFEEEIQVYDQLIALGNPNKTLLQERDDLRLFSEEYNKAIQNIELDIQADNPFRSAWHILVEIGKSEKAKQIFEIANKIDALKLIEATKVAEQAASFRAMGKDEEALQLYDRALVLNPKNVSTLRQKAYLLRDLHKYEEALQIINQLEDLYRSNRIRGYRIRGYISRMYLEEIAILDLRADLFHKMKRFLEEIKIKAMADRVGDMRLRAMRSARRLDFRDPWYDLLKEALENYEKEIAANSQDSALVEGRDQVLREFEKLDEELQKKLQPIEEAISLDPHDSSALQQKGYWLGWYGREAEAEEAYARAKELKIEESGGVVRCSLGHENPLGESFCDECGQPLP